MRRDWSGLGYDLTGEIAKKIACVEDFVSFSGVCRSWRLAAVKENWVPGRQLPWLVLVEKEDESTNANNSRRRGFFDLNKKKRYDLDIPQPGITRSWGSGIGLIVTVNLNLEFHIINPLSGLKLNLPHLYTLKHMPRSKDLVENPHPNSLKPTNRDYVDPIWFMGQHIRRALVFKTTEEQLCVAVLYGEFSFLAIARPGDKSWSEIDCGRSLIEDVVYFKGQELIALGCHGELIRCEFDWLHPPKSVTILPPNSGAIVLEKGYLVEFMGDLLMVIRPLNWYDKRYKVPYESFHFYIYKLDARTRNWMPLKNLGDMALFLGDSYSMSICSTDVVGCESNVIYFTDDNFIYWDSFKKCYGGNDIGVFSLKESVCRPLVVANILDKSDLYSTLSCPVWMIPNLF